MIDTHCHLTYPDFDKDRFEMFERAHAAGVEAFVTIGTGPDDWPRCLALAHERAEVSAGLGIHPNEAACFDDAVFLKLSVLASRERKVVAIGETGLDFFRDGAPREKQFAAFEAQLALASELDKPFILHCRAAENEMLDTLARHRDKTGKGLRGVWHCFGAKKEFGLRAAEMGLYFGLGGVITYPKSGDARAALAELPDDRLLLETDCPFLAPQAWRGKRNEPGYLSAVVQTISEVRGISPGKTRELTTANARRLFAFSA